MKNIKNMEREQAIEKFGLDNVTTLERLNCYPSGKVGYCGLQHGNKYLEFIAELKIDDIMLRALYFVDNDQERILDQGDEIDWQVEYFQWFKI